jgi:hypothetical protein
VREEREDEHTSNALDEGMLIRHMDVRRVTGSSGDMPARLAIMIEHMDGTNYMVSVADKKRDARTFGDIASHCRPWR